MTPNDEGEDEWERESDNEDSEDSEDADADAAPVALTTAPGLAACMRQNFMTSPTIPSS